MNPDNELKIESDWCYYLVAFLDVLGQKEVFNKIASIRSCEEIDDGTKQIISENLLFIEQFRNNLESFFEDYTKENQSTIIVEPSTKLIFDQMRKAEIYFQYFSDSVIAFVPLEFLSFYSVTVNGVWGLLGACGAAILGSLGLKHSIRGGIEVCWGTRLKSGEVYGPALNRAYHLESEVAEYPRIVISESVSEYLNSLSSKIQQHPAQTQIDIEACKAMADRCTTLISRDQNEMQVLDYLGRGFLELNKNSREYFELYDCSKIFIDDSIAYWTKKGNDRIESKYRYLSGYFESRSALVEAAKKRLRCRNKWGGRRPG